jgi:hypothetical protein
VRERLPAGLRGLRRAKFAHLSAGKMEKVKKVKKFLKKRNFLAIFLHFFRKVPH